MNRTGTKGLLFLLFFFSVATVSAQAPDPDTLVHRLVAAFRQQDTSLYVSGLPNRKQFGEILRLGSQKMDEGTRRGYDSIMQASLQAMSDADYRRAVLGQFVRGFRIALESGNGYGINWKNLRLLDHTREKSIREFVGVEEWKGVLRLSDGKDEWELRYDKLMHLPELGGYFGISVDIFRKRTGSHAGNGEGKDRKQ